SPRAAAGERDRDTRQAPERVRHRIDEVADRHEAAVDPGPVEPGEPVQDRDVAILHRRVVESEPADHGQPDGACTGGDEGQRVATLGHAVGYRPSLVRARRPRARRAERTARTERALTPPFQTEK